jgi:hypothetical protein
MTFRFGDQQERQASGDDVPPWSGGMRSRSIGLGLLPIYRGREYRK